MTVIKWLDFFSSTAETIISTLSIVWERLSEWSIGNWFYQLGDNAITRAIVNFLNSLSINGVIIGQMTLFDLMFRFLSIVIVISFIKWIINIIP